MISMICKEQILCVSWSYYQVGKRTSWGWRIIDNAYSSITWTKINFCDPISFHCMTSTFSTIKNGNVGRHINCCVEVVILANRQCIFKSVYRGIICTNIESKSRFFSLWKSSTTFFISFVLLIPLKNKKVIY